MPLISLRYATMQEVLFGQDKFAVLDRRGLDFKLTD